MYLANGIGYPVSIVHADVNNTITSVEYYTGSWMSIAQQSIAQRPELFPNPAGNSFTLLLPETGNYSVQIIDMFGRVVLTEAITGTNRENIDVAELAQGVYIVICRGENGIEWSERLVVQRQ